MFAICKHTTSRSKVHRIIITYPMKRIDLSQFEKIENWYVLEREDGTGFDIKTGRDHYSLAQSNAIAKLPTLVAELKRMYDREDGLISEAKDLIYYDKEDEMWRYDESKSGNPGLDAMDFVAEISTMNE